MSEKSKRVGGVLGQLLKFDVMMTDLFCKGIGKCFSLETNEKHFKSLEHTCNGIYWIAGTVLCIYLSKNTHNITILINFLFGLFIDIAIVGVLKAITRRRRPREATNMLTVSMVDKFSFPSGHATRSIFILAFINPMTGTIITFLVLLWAISVCLSRILLYRHHILDVACGVLIGYGEYLLLTILWLDETIAQGMLFWLVGLRAEDDGKMEL